MFDYEIDVKPRKFHPYSSSVTDRVFELDRYPDEIKSFLLNLFNEDGIKCQDDNKIVFECESYNGREIFIGFFDGVMAVGFGCRKW